MNSVVVIALFALLIASRTSAVQSSQREFCVDSDPDKFCLLVPEDNLSFRDAESYCQTLGKHLLKIKLLQEQKYVIETLRKISNSTVDFWFGLYATFGRYRWVSGDNSVPNVYFAAREKPALDTCFAVNAQSDTYTWKAIPCDTKLNFLCGTEGIQPSERRVLAQPSYCPPHFHHVGRACFQIVAYPLPWLEAAQYCIRRKAVLASIVSLEQQDYLTVLLSQTTSPAWIGLSLSHGEHRWFSNDSISFTNWKPGQPETSGEARLCTAILHRPHYLGQWEDNNCSISLPFICQAPAMSANSNNASVQLLSMGDCHGEFVEFEHRCYRVVPTAVSQLTSLSTEACPMRLAPHTLSEAAFMRVLLRNYTVEHIHQEELSRVWIGLSFTYNQSSNPQINFSVEDKIRDILPFSVYEKLTLTELMEVPHDRSFLFRRCAALRKNDSELDWISCDRKLPSICGYNLRYNLHPTAPSQCPSRWTRLGDKCYSFPQTVPVPWAEAELTCNQWNASLVSVHGSAEHQYLGRHLSFIPVWLGMRVNRKYPYWSDGSPVDYSSFAPGHTFVNSSAGAVESCIVLTEGAHDWRVVRCDDRYPYICQISLAPSTLNGRGNSPTPSTRFCSSTIEPKYCLEFHAGPATFVHAEDICLLRSTTLATISTEEQQKFLMDTLMTRTNFTKAYIGLFMVGKSLMWVSDYPSVPVAYWKHDALNSTEQCVYVTAGDQDLNSWDYGDCTNNLPFVCSSFVPVQKAPTVPFDSKGCAEPYIHIGSSCFLVKAELSDSVTWTDAIAMCAQLHPTGRLASIRTLREQDGLSVLIANASISPVWIGLHGDGHTYNWVDRSLVNFTNWAPGHPKSRLNRCVVISSDSQTVGMWMSVPCTFKAGYVCETDATKPSTMAKASKVIQQFNKGLCAMGYYQYRGNCYTLSKQSEIHARDRDNLHDEVSGICLSAAHIYGLNCATHPGAWGSSSCPITATPHNAVDAAFMRFLLDVFGMGSAEAWVGLKLTATNTSLKLHSEDGSVDGVSSLISYQSLPVAVASHMLDAGLICLVASTQDARLRFTPCNRTGLPVLCSYDPGKKLGASTPTSPLMTSCPPGWTLVSGQCYLAAPIDVRRNWPEAEKACQDAASEISTYGGLTHYGHLASIHTKDQQIQLNDLFHSTSSWIGLRILANAPNKSVHFLWSDSSPVDYLSSTIEQLQLLRPQSSCFTMEQSGVAWTPLDCYQSRSFICQLKTVRKDENLKIVSLESSQTAERCKTEKFSFSIPSSTACYHIALYSGSWTAAEEYCNALDPKAHLASIHSEIQMRDISILLSKYLSADAEIWFGLYEEGFAYTWSDKSPVDFVSLSADFSKEDRHLTEDCFTLVRDPSTGAGSFYVWKAVGCSTHRSGVVCQLSTSDAPSSQMVTDQPSGKLVSCPTDYHQFANRCFKVVTEFMSWDEANEACSKSVRSARFSGALATIDNGFVQEFLSSLLDNLPVGVSSAWMGLRRAPSEAFSKISWADHSPVRYLRSIYRQHKISSFTNNTMLCSALFRSTYPRINGLWLQMPCDYAKPLPSICQAIPLTPGKEGVAQPLSDGCPIGFHLGPIGLSSASSMSKPTCYRLLNRVKMSWKDAVIACRKLTTVEHNVTALSVASVFEASFLRTWLPLSRKFGGCELPLNEPVWSGLQVSDLCPECLRNWAWNSSEPIRYTDWLIPPSPLPSGCYLFYSNLYGRGDRMSANGLGSLRPASSCTSLHYAVCQTVAKASGGQSKSVRTSENMEKQITSRFTTYGRIPSRPPCFKLDETNANSEQFLAEITVSKSNKPCIRWDLVPTSLNSYHLASEWTRPRMSAAVAVGSDGTPSYAENYCSVVFNTTSKQSVYGCYTSLRPLQFELCRLQKCDILRSTTTHWALWLFFVFVVIGAGLLGVALWRGCTPIRLGYRRQFTRSHRSTRQIPRIPVHFTPSEGISTTCSNGDAVYPQSIGLSSTNGSEENHSPLMNTKANGDKPTDYYGRNPLRFAKIAKLGGYPAAYHNPIYTTLPEPTPEDDYDPEA